MGGKMKLKDAAIWILIIAFLWGAFNALKPYWNKYWLGKELQNVAIYGTQHSIASTRNLLDKKMRQDGRPFKGEDFGIEKNEQKDVTITLHYGDQISVFGKTLKKLEFTVTGNAQYIPPML